MSFGRVVHEDRQAREQAYRDAGKRCAARIAAASAWVARHMPECIDEKHGPNSLVIAAAMGVSDARGFEHVWSSPAFVDT